ncbi:MAG TPA: alcohol dehydrogenase catalytic domain-containing protein [Acidimicrobiales bacterium]|nr:alcohol dehydrogenase catalytic domain-containing protein [Acidimicrobiales bacterium]
MSSVRTATVSAPHQLEISEADVPKPTGDQVVVQIRYCGVCGTDVHGFESPELLPRAVFGHEWTGTIVDAGDGVETVSVGDRVSVAVGPPCGRCSMCRSGNADHCDTAFAEANGVTPDAPEHGGFSTHLAVSERRVVRLLPGLSDEQGALVEPTAVTFRAVRRTRIPLGSVVVVQGAGPIGLLCAQQARHAGAARTFVVEPVLARREAATALGFADVFEPGATFADALRTATDGRGADVLFECTGVAKLLQPSAELVRRGGMLSLVGYTAELSSVSYGDWVSRELRLVASLAYTHQDFLGAMATLASGAVEVGPVITGTVGLSEFASVLTDLRSGSTQYAKVLVDPAR